MSGILVVPYAFVRRASAPAKWRALRFVIAPWWLPVASWPTRVSRAGRPAAQISHTALIMLLNCNKMLKFHTCHCADVIVGLQSRLGDGLFK